MLPIYDYDVFIFDCDGVILDSNKLKIDAMQQALELIIKDSAKVKKCVDYFRNNFGRSRFHHIDIFIEKFLQLDKYSSNEIRAKILNAYSIKCKSLYLKAVITPGFIDFIRLLKGKKYIASGSEQQELREVFKERGLDIYFDDIYGSPTRKSELVANILRSESSNNAVMLGDAISDLEAAQINDIDFIAYIPFSNVPVELTKRSRLSGFNVINSWSELFEDKV